MECSKNHENDLHDLQMTQWRTMILFFVEDFLILGGENYDHAHFTVNARGKVIEQYRHVYNVILVFSIEIKKWGRINMILERTRYVCSVYVSRLAIDRRPL